MLKLSPPGLVAGAGYGAYTLTSAILENGLEATAISIAKGIVDLPYELKARLNSTDPTVSGEALVDVIALGSSTAYLTQKLGIAVVNTTDQAIAKAVAKAATEAVSQEIIFKTAHYALRLESAGINVGRAESAVFKEVIALRGSLGTNADFVGRLSVDGVLVEYRARLLTDGTVNIGTLFPVK